MSNYGKKTTRNEMAFNLHVHLGELISLNTVSQSKHITYCSVYLLWLSY